eukprot:gene5300-5741_t
MPRARGPGAEDAAHLQKIFDIGEQNRSSRGTDMNERSSRSHTTARVVFSIKIQTLEGGKVVREGKLAIADLPPPPSDGGRPPPRSGGGRP